MGASRKWVADLERGKPSVDANLVLKALKVLDITLDATVAGEEPLESARMDSAAVDLDEHLDGLRRDI